MQKQFMVVELPKNEDEPDYVGLEEPTMWDDYGPAFDQFNERIAQEGRQIFKMPKGTPPLRVALQNCNVELWVISRAETLTTTD